MKLLIWIFISVTEMALKMFRHKFPTVASRLKQWRRPGLDVVHAVLRSWHSLLGTQARLLQRDRFEKGIAECQSRNLTEPVGEAANHNWPRLAILLLFYIVFITHGLSTAVSVSMVTSLTWIVYTVPPLSEFHDIASSLKKLRLRFFSRHRFSV